MNAPTESIEMEIQQFVSRRVAEGFDSEEDIVEGALEFFEHDFPGENLPQLAARLADEAMRKHLDDEKTWSQSTDCDKLDKVFESLESTGIVARQNFTCCQSCGHAEIWEEIEQVRQESTQEIPVAGYVFYHQQDTERACDEGVLYLAYGAADSADATALEIATRISSLLKENGFNVDWNGSLDKRICLLDLDWRRRRFVAS